MIVIYKKQSSKNHLHRRKSYILVNFKTWVSINRLPNNPAPFFHKLISHEPAIQTKSSTWSAWSTSKKHVTSMSPKSEPAIWSRDTGQKISQYDSCQLNIICMSNIKDICCNPRPHDLALAGWPPCCATSSSSSFVVARRTRPWSIPVAISTVRKELHGFLFLCIRVRSPVSVIMELCLAVLRAARAPLLFCHAVRGEKTIRFLASFALIFPCFLNCYFF